MSGEKTGFDCTAWSCGLMTGWSSCVKDLSILISLRCLVYIKYWTLNLRPLMV